MKILRTLFVIVSGLILLYFVFDKIEYIKRISSGEDFFFIMIETIFTGLPMLLFAYLTKDLTTDGYPDEPYRNFSIGRKLWGLLLMIGSIIMACFILNIGVVEDAHPSEVPVFMIFSVFSAATIFIYLAATVIYRNR